MGKVLYHGKQFPQVGKERPYDLVKVLNVNLKRNFGRPEVGAQTQGRKVSLVRRLKRGMSDMKFGGATRFAVTKTPRSNIGIVSSPPLVFETELCALKMIKGNPMREERGR